MSESLKKSIIEFLKPQVSDLGFASVDRFSEAPEGHHPGRVCRNAQTVIVFGITVPRGMLKSPDYSLYALHRTYHSAYTLIDHLSLALCNFIESRGKYLAVPVPSYAPMIFHQCEPWGTVVPETCGSQGGDWQFRPQRTSLPSAVRIASAAGCYCDGCCPRGRRSAPPGSLSVQMRSLPYRLSGQGIHRKWAIPENDLPGAHPSSMPYTLWH